MSCTTSVEFEDISELFEILGTDVRETVRGARTPDTPSPSAARYTMRHPGLLLLVAALACGTPSGQHPGQSLKPAADTTGSVEDPVLACVDAVLTNSTLLKSVTTVRSTARSREYGLGPRNPPSRWSGLRFTAHASRDGTKGFAVEFIWPGPWMGAEGGGMKPPPDPGVYDGAGEMLRDIGAGVLRDVRAECAPNMPGEPACMRVNQGRGGRCSLGGK